MHVPAIPDIISRYISAEEYYQPLLQEVVDYPSVKAWLCQIKDIGFSDKMASMMIAHILALRSQGRHDEASMLLLVSVAAEEKQAIYLLGRELYLGEFFPQNHAESYQIFRTMANEGNVEAICDLALFYEQGMVVQKDLETAKKLYQRASGMGLGRAASKLRMLEKSSRSGIFAWP
jgi:TPR repeat protein